MLLAILAGVLLAVLGLPPRLRMVLIVAAIAVYVPIAGGGPSIQRAGVMGAAAIAAGLLGRAADRAWIVLAGAAVTLMLQPLAATDIGWQFSFAAVIGISLVGGPDCGVDRGTDRSGGSGASARAEEQARRRHLPRRPG